MENHLRALILFLWDLRHRYLLVELGLEVFKIKRAVSVNYLLARMMSFFKRKQELLLELMLLKSAFRYSFSKFFLINFVCFSYSSAQQFPFSLLSVSLFVLSALFTFAYILLPTGTAVWGGKVQGIWFGLKAWGDRNSDKGF